MSIPYIGDFAEDEEIYHYFNTFDSNDPAASVTITNLASTDLYVHKDGVDSTETTVGATVDIDFDTQTGIHKVTVDTSADVFYATGSDYMVRMEGTTVDGATINAALFTFSIENRYTRGTDSAALASNYTSARAGYLDNINGHTAQTGDTYALANGATGFVAIDTVVDAVAADLANGTDGLGALKTLIDAVQSTADAVETDTQDLQTQIGTDGAGLTDLGGMSAGMQAEVNAEVDTALDTSIAELGVAAPTATPTVRTALMLLYMALRNQTITQTSGTDALEIYNDAGTLIAKKLLTDDSSDYTEDKMTSG